MSSPSPESPDFFSTDAAADAAMTYFYARLFAAEPEIRAMFPAAMDGQRRRLYAALCRIADGTRDAAGLESYLSALGRGHRKYGVRPEHYGPFTEALEATFLRYPPDAGRWTELERAASIARAAEVMASAASADAGPAWWTAEVISNELRTPHVAVLTLRPGKPYPYLAGQHASVQTPHWPRVWRRYSIANAPAGAEDGLLTLHIRVVPGGLVSTAMLHAAAGDTVLLGPAEGTMTADPDSPRDALCLAGGTGLAPVKAVAEALLARPRPGRRVTLYFGARTGNDLYDLPALRAMERDHPALTVHAVTSEERVPHALHGTVPGLAADGVTADTGPAGRDVYISGPDLMIDAAVRRLAGLGVPPERLHYDLPSGCPA
ncbi:MAG: FAD-binding oxidoreductase [Streptosporangiales bacterium]|nr:FAD-binding oxidoreductase [Streptosporangiales bacterium]